MARKNPLKNIKVSRIIYPVIIGLGVIIFMAFRKIDPDELRKVELTSRTAVWLLFAFGLMAFRDFGYMLRLKILADNELTWRQCFRVVMLWEFTSAITPSAVGGTSLAIIYVNKENIGIGKSSAIVMATSFLDELYFLIVLPLLLLIIGWKEIFYIDGALANKFFYPVLIGYSLKLAFTLVLSYGLFINPRGLKWMLLWIFKLPILRRWRQGAHEAGSEIITSSKELRKKPLKFWLKAFGASIISWTSRYWVMNAVFLAFFVVSDHFIIFTRQLVAWIMMLVFPTPGGSGFSEFVIIEYLQEFIPGSVDFQNSLAPVLALLWRLISYYPYLLIGVIVFPRWIRLKFGQSGTTKNK